jgi:hypothetical protein
LLLYSSYLPLGVSQLAGHLLHYHRAIYSNQDFFWRRCWGKRRLLQGEFRMHILYFVLSFAFTLFLLVSFYQKHKKISFLIVVFNCLLLALLEWLLMRTPSCVILLG